MSSSSGGGGGHNNGSNSTIMPSSLVPLAKKLSLEQVLSPMTPEQHLKFEKWKRTILKLEEGRRVIQENLSLKDYDPFKKLEWVELAVS